MRRARMRLQTRLGAILVLLAMTGFGGGGDDAIDIRDRLGTLQLDARLDSRGQLGGVAVDRLGFIYIANFRDKLWRVSPEGEVELLTNSLYGGSGIGVDSRGDIYQSNFNGNSISRIRRTGEVSIFASQGLSGPVGIAIDAEDNLYVCNCNGNSIAKVDPSGAAVSFATSELLACPNGITFDDRSQLYVTSFNSTDIARISPDGAVEKFATVPGGAGNAHIAFSKGFFYVTKIIANRVVKISREGQPFPLAGSGAGGHDDGPALEATLSRPNGIAVAPSGVRIYVNTLVGPYQGGEPTSISIRTVDLTTLAQLLEGMLERGGPEEVERVYRLYRQDPVRSLENTSAEMIGFGYRLLSNRKAAQALQIFQLNAASYPHAAAAQYHLGEAFRYTGQTDKAVQQYQRVLEIDPDHAQARSRLKQLGA